MTTPEKRENQNKASSSVQGLSTSWTTDRSSGRWEKSKSLRSPGWSCGVLLRGTEKIRESANTHLKQVVAMMSTISLLTLLKVRSLGMAPKVSEMDGLWYFYLVFH